MKNESTASAKANLLVGYFDGMKDGYATGWAYTPANIKEPVTIEIICKNEVVGAGVANLYREDLQLAGIGNGLHLFRIKLSYELCDNGVHFVSARDAKTGSALKGGLHSTGRMARTREFALMSRAEGTVLLKEMLTFDQYIFLKPKEHNIIKAYRVASILQETGELSESNKAWLMIEQVLGKNALTTHKLGEISLLKGEISQAIEYFRAATNLDPNFYWSYCGIGNAQVLLGKYNDAEASFNKAIEIRPLLDASRFYATRTHEMQVMATVSEMLSQQKKDEALRLLENELIKNPDELFFEHKLVELSIHAGNILLPGIEALAKVETKRKILDRILDGAEPPRR